MDSASGSSAVNQDIQREPATRTTLRAIAVISLASFVLVLTIPNIWANRNGLPFTIDTHERVTSVFDARLAGGIRVGDVLDFRAATLTERLALTGAYYLLPDERMRMHVIRGDRRFETTVSPIVSASSSVLLTVLKRGAATCFVVIAALLLLRRPSRMLWGFFGFAIGSVNGDPLAYATLPILIYFGLYNAIVYLVFAVGPIGLWVFASRFPQDRSGGWRQLADRAALPALIVLTIVDGVTIWQTLIGAVPWDTTLLSAGVFAIGLLCFVDAYVHLRADERQRLKWVLLGIIATLVAFVYQSIAGRLPGGGWPTAWSNAGWTVDVLSAVQVSIPLTVAYAVLKHRVIDVNFVISRALVYGIVTTVVIGVFAMLDWVFTKALSTQRVAAVVEIVAALVMGFSLNAMHKFVDNVVDRVLFRRRHLAELRLARATAGVRHVTASSAIDETLTEEPVDAMGLTSAAVFQLSSTGVFERTRAIGWPEGTDTRIDANDSLVQNLQGERGVVRLRDVRRPSLSLPQGAAAPALAVPLFVRHMLDGFALYGPHASGEDFDPIEVRLLEELAAAAAATYDHLDAEAARKDAERLERELREARRTLATFGAIPAS